MLVLLQVNSNLKKLSDDKEGIPSHEPIPFYRNKVYLTFCLVLFVIGGYFVVQAAIGLGRSKTISPSSRSSIRIKCMPEPTRSVVCTVMVAPGKASMAGVPSLNVCMNCHAAINDYKGEPCTVKMARKWMGPAEIQKLISIPATIQRPANTQSPANRSNGSRSIIFPIMFSSAMHSISAQAKCSARPAMDASPR